MNLQCLRLEGLCISQVLQCVAVCCSVLQCLEELFILQAKTRETFAIYAYMLHINIHLSITHIYEPAMSAPGRKGCVFRKCCSVLQCVAVCCSVLQCLEGLCISQAKTREIFDKHIYIHIHVKKNLHLYIHLHKFTSIHIPAICAPGRAVCIAGRDARDIQIRLHFVRWSATS